MRLHRLGFPWTAAVVVSALASAPSAPGAIIDGTFAGVVDFVDPALSGQFSVGQSLTGAYSFDSTAGPRTGSDSNFAFYDAVTSLSFTVGSLSAASTATAEIQIDNDPPSPFFDRYGISALSLASAPNSTAPSAFALRMDDPTNTVFSDALILPLDVHLSSFGSGAFFVFFGTSSISGTLTALDAPTGIPEPSSVLLVLTGLGLAAAAARRGRA